MFGSVTIPLSVIALLSQVISVLSLYGNDELKRCHYESSQFAYNEDQYPSYDQTYGPYTSPQFIAPPGAQLLKDMEYNHRFWNCMSGTCNGTGNLWSQNMCQNLVNECTSYQTNLQCDYTSPYRTYDGTCNNVINPSWGSAMSCCQRNYPPNYSDGFGPRRSVVDGGPLPEPRDLSLNIFTAEDQPIEYNSLWIYMLQPLAHDLCRFSTTYIKGQQLDCCSYGEKQHPQCMPIYVRNDDYFYSRFNVKCLNFVRAVPCDSCAYGKRDPVTLTTSYLDSSTVYGWNKEMIDGLRTWDGTGKLKMNGELLPQDKSQGYCGDPKRQYINFGGGDPGRMDTHCPIMMFQTLFARQHNSIAEQMKYMNPHWDGERTFQETRKYCIAYWAVVSYNELLEPLLGKDIMKKYGLTDGSGDCYDPTINPSCSVVFNSAAFRLHSMIPGHTTAYAWLRDLYANCNPLYDGQTGYFLKSMSEWPSQKNDAHCAKDITDWLYRPIDGPYHAWGQDLTATDIQRGRDVGLPTYCEMRKYLTNGQPESCGSLFCPKCRERILKQYKNIKDVDLWVGLSCEKTAEGAKVGPTSAAIIAEHFWKVKCGDRFWWEWDKSFSPEQKEELKKASVAKMICDYTDVKVMQTDAMKPPSCKNEEKPCSEITGVNLTAWKENRNYGYY